MVRDKSDNPEQEKIEKVNFNIPLKKVDGWSNVLAGIGRKSKDKSENNFFKSDSYDFLDDNELTNIYAYDGLGASIINMLADDMTKAWFTINGDIDGKIQDELKRLKAHSIINECIKWARLYRGCIAVMMYEGDKSDWSKPAPKNIKGLTGLRIYSAPRINITTTDIVDDPDSPYFDEVEIFPVIKRNGVPFKVHESRCLVFKGLPAPDYDQAIDFQYRYWGLPVFVQVYQRLSNYSVVEKAIGTLMMEASIGKYTLKNLASLLAQNDSASLQKIYDRIDIINASKSILNAVLLGEGEDYVRDTISLSGVEGIIDRMMMNLASVTNYPVTKLFGRSPAGENATGEGDLINYYDKVSSMQDTWLIFPIQRLVDTIASYEKIVDTTITFNPLLIPTEESQAKTKKLNTESDKLDVDMGVYTPEEIRKNRGVED